MTANITLQEQLFRKDLPLISEVLQRFMPSFPFKFALVKGMSNYLCRQKLDELGEKPPAEDWYEEISAWEENTSTGDKSELDTEYPIQIWGRVSSSSDECLRRECPRWEGCYVSKARETDVDVVVTNYHMLYSDAMVRAASSKGEGILPAYRNLIMDEVHKLVDTVRTPRSN